MTCRRPPASPQKHSTAAPTATAPAASPEYTQELRSATTRRERSAATDRAARCARCGELDAAGTAQSIIRPFDPGRAPAWAVGGRGG
jgi:hypothetical protein